MIIKEQLYKVADGLPFNASVEDAIDNLLLLYKIETGLKQADEEKIIPHQEVEERVEKWLK